MKESTGHNDNLGGRSPSTRQLPEHLQGSHFGETLTSYILYQHYHLRVTQPLIHKQLTEFGIDISRG
ncbi:MAG: hypothetical protein HOJ19_14095, partial [Candidatus Marinimicrobia bacterium]|nr:hypothetical protein [Candidatus Neomarinimicrobiota bacterium]MBT6304454.1 hypothetical protein [Candidatus Neomarinimicrobiota bacterium]